MNAYKSSILFFIFTFSLIKAHTQSNRWQQRVQYTMNVKVDIEKNILNGTQHIIYYNNSPDTLRQLFIHIYWNAFQPNSMMDVRSKILGEIILGNDKNGNPVRDWDVRVKDRIANLKANEMGFQKIVRLKVNGQSEKIIEHETIAEVVLSKPIMPKSKVRIETEFEAQIPIQIRRSGRDNAEGVRYSMSQWYPKICEYDEEGWHPTFYVAREFYGTWGDYDVTININKNYLIAATGYLQNPTQVGFGYENKNQKLIKPAKSNLIWHFIAPRVHDFVWAADTAYKHVVKELKNGPVLHFVYKKVDSLELKWKYLIDGVVQAYPFISKTFGAYPYKQYTFIQGGDGGMEYPMATLIKSPSLGTAIHEWMHSWYQMVLGTNETLHPWMDEGFTEYATDRVMAFLDKDTSFVYQSSYNNYYHLVQSKLEEPMTTPSDYFNTNIAYNIASYSKGSIFLEQLGYIVGAAVRDSILLAYYQKWRFKHPNPNDFIRVAEKVSGLQLQWYKQYWVNTTKTIDYAIDSLWQEGKNTNIRIKNIGKMPMPIDVLITYKDGMKELHYIPLNLMLGNKPAENAVITRKLYPEWKWTHPTYVIQSSRKLTDIISVEIDPSLRMADIDRKNNKLQLKW